MKKKLILVLLLLLPALAHAEAENLTISKETLMRMQQMIAQGQQRAAFAQGEMAYWFEEYRQQKDCVRASKTHAEALACIGDTEL
jgi:predicted metal-dependent hydrolase